MKHVHDVLMSNAHSAVSDVFESSPNSQFWLKTMETIKDNYAVEKISEQLLHQLAAKCESDVDAYWVLWLLFHRSLRSRMSVRSVIKNCRSNTCVSHPPSPREREKRIKLDTNHAFDDTFYKLIVCTVSGINSYHFRCV